MPALSCKRSIRSNDNKIGVNIQWHWSEFDNTKGGFFSGFQSIHTHANQTQSFAIIASESEGEKKYRAFGFLSWLWRRCERELGTGLFARRIKELLAAKRKTSKQKERER
jgi:hypothetical protein